MTTARGSWGVALAAWGVSAALVFGAVGIGLRVSGLRLLDPLPAGALLDYSRAPYAAFAPLRDAFVAGVLGLDRPIGDDAAGESADTVTGTPQEAVPLALGAAATPGPQGTPAGAPPEDPASTPGGRPPNDGFERAANVSVVPYTARGDSRRATRQEGEPTGCAPVGATGGTVWYRHTAEQNGGLVAHTVGSDHPTELAVFTGRSLDDVERVGCDYDAAGNARVAFAGTAGTTYHLRVTAPVVGGKLWFALEFVGSTTRASVSSAGAEGDHASADSFVSADGRWVAFVSQATTLDPAWRQPNYLVQPDATQGVPAPEGWWNIQQRPSTCRDHAATGYSGDSAAYSIGNRPCAALVYVRNRVTHETVLVSVSTDGAQADGYWIYAPALSADGRHVSFTSDSSNLAEPRVASPWGEAGGGGFNAFVRDRDTDRDGVFDEPGAVRTVRVSDSVDGEQQAGTFDGADHMSADGRYVAFYSNATNLVHDTNDDFDVFVRDRDADGDGVFDERGAVTTERMSVSSDEEQARGGSLLNCMTRDGRYVAFRSTADNLVAGDTNGVMDTFVRDRVTGTTERTSLTWDGRQQNADSAISASGTQWCLSDDARHHVFASSASNLVPGDTNGMVDLFVRDRVAATTVRVSVAWDGAQATTGDSNATNAQGSSDRVNCYVGFGAACDTSTATGHAMSRDGRLVAFSSPAHNLLPGAGDTNGAEDIFVRDLVANTTYRVSVSSAGNEADLWSTGPRLSDDGRFVSFSSLASNLVDGDTNGTVDVFVRELPGPWGPSGWR